MASNSSIFSSDAPDLPGGFPWALAGTLAIVLLVELGVRLANPMNLIAYSSVRDEHAAVADFLAAAPRAEVGFVGSSMTRRGISAPLVREAIERKSGNGVYVANYGCRGLVADEGKAVVRYMIRSDKAPRLLLYEASILQFRSSGSSRAGLRAIFLGLEDWIGDWLRTGESRTEELPIVIRREAGKWWLTLRHRERAKEWTTEFFGFARRKSNPILGEYLDATGYKNHVPDSPDKRAAMIAKWFEGRMRNGRYREMDKSLAADFEEILGACRENGIDLVIYETPLWQEVWSRIPTETIDEFYRTVEELARRHRTPFYRIKDLGLNLGDEHFIDAVHLNQRGAEMLTQSLTTKVILPRLDDHATTQIETDPGN